MRLFLVSIFMTVCGNSYVIVYTSENSLSVKRIKLIVSKLQPNKPELITASTNVTPAMRSSLATYFSWPCSLPILPKVLLLPLPPLFYETLPRISRNGFTISRLLPFQFEESKSFDLSSLIQLFYPFKSSAIAQFSSSLFYSEYINCQASVICIKEKRLY